MNYVSVAVTILYLRSEVRVVGRREDNSEFIMMCSRFWRCHWTGRSCLSAQCWYCEYNNNICVFTYMFMYTNRAKQQSQYDNNEQLHVLGRGNDYILIPGRLSDILWVRGFTWLQIMR